MYECLPLVSVLPELINSYTSEMVNHLTVMGIVAIASDVVKHGIPLAGRLRYFLQNWRIITQDQWVLEAVQGYRIPFTREPQQPVPPRQIVLSQEGASLIAEEVREMGRYVKPCPEGGASCPMSSWSPKKTEGRDPLSI